MFSRQDASPAIVVVAEAGSCQSQSRGGRTNLSEAAGESHVGRGREMWNQHLA
jgi:hypothetical protein